VKQSIVPWKHWPHVAPLLTAPQSAAEYDRLVRVLDELLDAGAADEGMDPPWCSA
jgi:hypothetical protein